MTGPRLSVVIPSYDRAAVLRLCLESLRRQSCPRESFEIVIADDGSPDATRRVAEEAARLGPPRVVYLRQPNSGANAARNRAVAAAQGELLLFINDDTIATPAMVGRHLAAHEAESDERVAVLGRVTVSPELPPSRLAPLHLDRAFAALGGRRDHDWRAFFTCNVSLKRSLLARTSGFEERIRYHEDLELAERLSHHGLRVVYEPEALGYHHHFLTESEFLAIARREARALNTWARVAPRVSGMLGELGYEPALPTGRRVRHRVLDLVVNDITRPGWCWMARRLPTRLEPLAHRIYDQVYASLRRSWIRREQAADSGSPERGTT